MKTLNCCICSQVSTLTSLHWDKIHWDSTESLGSGCQISESLQAEDGSLGYSSWVHLKIWLIIIQICKLTRLHQ